MVAGDANTHHPRWDPRAPKSRRADELLSAADAAALEVLNDGHPTLTRGSLQSAPDVAFADITTASDAVWGTVSLPSNASNQHAVVVIDL